MRLESFVADADYPLDYLRAVWPEAVERIDAGLPIPPMDDEDVAAHLGDLPDWFMDKYEVLVRVSPEGLVSKHARPGHGVVKPRFNPSGLGMGARFVRGVADVPEGYFWQRRFYGRHLSYDFAILRGTPQWGVVAEGFPMSDRHFGQFAAWCVAARTIQDLSNVTPLLLNLGYPDYSGVLNVETIHPGDGFYIVEIHFRPSIEFGPLYGARLRRELLLAALGEASAPASPIGGVHLPCPREPRPGRMVVQDEQPADGPTWRKAVIYYPEADA